MLGKTLGEVDIARRKKFGVTPIRIFGGCGCAAVSIGVAFRHARAQVVRPPGQARWRGLRTGAEITVVADVVRLLTELSRVRLLRTLIYAPVLSERNGANHRYLFLKKLRKTGG